MSAQILGENGQFRTAGNSRQMYPLELSKEKVIKFQMEFVPIRFEHNEVIDNRKTCTELPAVRNYLDIPYKALKQPKMPLSYCIRIEGIILLWPGYAKVRSQLSF